MDSDCDDNDDDNEDNNNDGDPFASGEISTC